MIEHKYHRLRMEITGLCNLKCKYCFNSVYNEKEQRKDEISFDEIKKMILDASEMGIKDYYLIGGEPFMHPQIFDILDYIKRIDGNIIISTNGTLINDQLIEKLKDYTIKDIAISLDGFSSHDLIRIGSQSNQVIDAIKKIRDNITKNISIITVVNNISKDELLKTYNVLKGLKVKTWDVNHMFLKGRSTEHIDELALNDYDELFDIYVELLKKYFKDGKPINLAIHNVYNSLILTEGYDSFNENSHPCEYYMGIIPVKPDAEIVMCPNLTSVSANFRKYLDLKKTLDERNNDEFYLLKLKDLKKCLDCRYLKICGSGCRAEAKRHTGDSKAPDPIACVFMRKMEELILPLLPEREQENYRKLILEHNKFPTINKLNPKEIHDKV